MKNFIKSTFLNSILAIYITSDILYAIYRASIKKPVDTLIFLNWNLGHIESKCDNILKKFLRESSNNINKP